MMNQTNHNQDVMVSISCLTYNHGSYIRQCLEGFMMQKTNFSFEVLIHDDASTDGTTEIIKEFEAKYPDVIKPIYEEENQWVKGRGGSAEFNFPRAKGKYIAMCEGDDYWIDPLKLQKQVDFLENNLSYIAIGTQSLVIFEDGSPNRLYNNLKNTITWNKGELLGFRKFHTASLLFKNIDVMSKLPSVHSGDIIIMGTLSIFGNVYFLPEVTTVYRKHSDGASSNVKLNNLKSDLAMVPFIKSIAPHYNINKLKTYLYYTFAFFPIKQSYLIRLKYALLSVILSFSYFPKNKNICVLTIKRLLKQIMR